MKCECGKEVFDIYTNEQRIKDLYRINNAAGWAKTQLKHLSEMLDPNEPHIEYPPTIDWIREKILKVINGIETIK